MVAMNQIEELGCRIGKEFGARKVILFGSYARGTASAEAADALTVYGVATRYPGDWRQIGPDETEKAIRLARDWSGAPFQDRTVDETLPGKGQKVA